MFIFVSMKRLHLLSLLIGCFLFGQNIHSIQLFNPKTNDETPIIGFNDNLILSFDDFDNGNTSYRYTIKHFDRNWQDDELFFTEYASGNLNALINNYQYSFNTLQKYTHYTLSFPNKDMMPKISGNYEIIVYKDSPSRPIFTRRFCITENNAQVALNISRYNSSKQPNLNQRIQVQAIGNIDNNLNSITLSVIQNNNWNLGIFGQKPSGNMGNKIVFQQFSLAFPGNNEFYYFDNKNITQPFDMVVKAETIDNVNYTYLYPVSAYPLNYQYQPDTDGAFYFRRNDLGQERNADTEGDYSWVYFSLDSEKMDKDIYVLGGFNNYTADKRNQMHYDEDRHQYIAKIYLKQGFYSYLLVTKEGNSPLNYNEINGNFWETENLYQAFIYYHPFGQNYDALIGYGELRNPVR